MKICITRLIKPFGLQGRILAIFLSLFVGAPAIADMEADMVRHGAFDRAVSDLKCDASKTIIRTGPDGIKVTCTVLPCEQLIGVAWEIYNPRKIMLDIKPEDIKLYNQVREREAITPVKAAGMVYGTPYEKPVADPFIDAQTPSSYNTPAITSASQGVKDVFASAFNFGKTDAVRMMGIVYYTRLGANEKLTSTINLNGTLLKFEF